VRAQPPRRVRPASMARDAGRVFMAVFSRLGSDVLHHSQNASVPPTRKK
jgi:hypothetical protein